MKKTIATVLTILAASAWHWSTPLAYAASEASTKATPSPVTPAGKYPKPSGNALYDGLGANLPAGLDADTLVGLVMPMGDTAMVSLVGAKPWPRRENSYAVIVCTRGEGVERPRTSECVQGMTPGTTGVRRPVTAYVGVVERVSDGTLRLVAASGPIDAKTDWSDTSMPSPIIAEEGDTQGHLLPERWSNFDMASYRIRNDDYAFGLRAGWSESYAGGGANFEALYLFSIEGDKLKVILAEPMFAFRDVAGEWNPDGTREHEIEEETNILVMTNRLTNGHYDVRIKTKGKDNSYARTMKWSVRDSAYVEAK